MFEDSTFESNGRIHTRSRAWMLGTCAFNGSILVAMVLVPLIYPSALPQMMKSYLMESPAPQHPEPKPVMQAALVASVPSQFEHGRISAPSLIPKVPFIPVTQEISRPVVVAAADFGDDTDTNIPLGAHAQRAQVRQAASGPVRVLGMAVEGLLIHKTIPVYPPVAQAAGIQGIVVLQAAISRSGTIENLHVISGPLMLQQAAINAVQQWRYRPYLLSGEPVAVETTVNVIFKLY